MALAVYTLIKLQTYMALYEEEGRTYPLGKGRRLPWAPKAKGPLKCFSNARCALSADTRTVAVYGVYYHDNRMHAQAERASCVSCL